MEYFKPREDLVPIDIYEPEEMYDSREWFKDSLEITAERYARIMADKLNDKDENHGIKIIDIAKKLFGIPEPEKCWRVLTYEPCTEFDKKGRVEWNSHNHIDVAESGKVLYLLEKVRFIDGEPVSIFYENNAHSLIISRYSDAEEYLNQVIRNMNFNLGSNLIKEVGNS